VLRLSLKAVRVGLSEAGSQSRPQIKDERPAAIATTSGLDPEIAAAAEEAPSRRAM